MDLERAIQMRRGIGQDQYVDGLEAPLGIDKPSWKGGNIAAAVEPPAGPAGRIGGGVGGGGDELRRLSSLFYPVVMLLTTLVIFVFIKLRGLLLFRRLLGLFVSS